MTPFEIVVIISCVLVVSFVIVKTIFDKKKGKNSCGSCCERCKYAFRCNSNDKNA